MRTSAGCVETVGEEAEVGDPDAAGEADEGDDAGEVCVPASEASEPEAHPVTADPIRAMTSTMCTVLIRGTTRLR